MKPSYIAALFILQFSAILANAAILAGPFVYPVSGHRYYLLTSNKWIDSQSEAITLGGNLVTINNLAENQWVFDTFGPLAEAQRPATDDSPSLWIGLSDAALEGTFSWISGEAVLFTYWDVGQPNNSGGDQDFVEMRVRPPTTLSAGCAR